MILQSSHNHHHHSHLQQFPQPFSSIFNNVLQSSQYLIKETVSDEIGLLKRYYEQKVYLSYCDDPSQYLLHMLHKNQNQTKDHITEMIISRERKVTKAIKKKKYKVKTQEDGNRIKKIRDQLSGKITEMKEGMQNLSQVKVLSKSKGEQDSQQLYKGYMQFRKKGYWKEKSQKSQKVKEFLNKMHKMRKQINQDHLKHEKIHEQNIRIRELKQKKVKDDENSKLKQDFMKKRERAKSERIQRQGEQQERKKEINKLLSNYRHSKPLYITNEERFRREILQPMEDERKKKLAEIKKQKQPLDSQELELHQQRYEQFRQKLIEAHENKQQDQQIYEKNMEKLKELYHCHFHQKVQEEMQNYQNVLREKKKIRERILQYSGSVKDEFKPKLDKKKKEEVQKTIKLLQQQEQKGKKKIFNKDGSISYEEISPEKKRKVGLSYLEYLRKYNEGKKRKQPEDRSASMMQLSKKNVKRDYLKQMRQQSRAQSAKTNKTNKGRWRKIISNDSFSNKDKYASVMDHVELLEHEAKQKEIQLKYIKGGDKAIDLKEELDKYYLESVAAKMHVLKDVMLR